MIYSGEQLQEISFPLGGIGTGALGLAGNGSFVDWEIYNLPNKGTVNDYTFFAVSAKYPDGHIVTKVLQGDKTKDLSGQYTRISEIGYGLGPIAGTMCGFPHFKNVVFDGKFPIARLTFTDDNFPATVILTAFNPFIPLDAKNSGIPAAFFNVEIENREKDVEYTVVFSVRNPYVKSKNIDISDKKYKTVIMKNDECTPDDVKYGELCVAADAENSFVQEYWYRGKWKDHIQTFWYELENRQLHPRHYDDSGVRDVCSVGGNALLKSGENKNFKFVLSWNVPNDWCYWAPFADDNGKEVTWKTYYATVFSTAADSCKYSIENWDGLYKKTKTFCDALHNSSLDSAVIDAASATLSVLKSPTVLRLQDGTFWAWEGVYEQVGSCMGTCTHVWNYAYAMCFLFPELERGLRDCEFKYDVNAIGAMRFRTPLPLERAAMMKTKPDEFILPCVDGQMGSVIKAYREWKISGDNEWLKANWENIKKILEYAWHPDNFFEWDKDKDGVLEGRQHHTLDMELFGPSSWLEGMYLAALKAASEMADFLGDDEKAKEYSELYEKGRNWTKENLFNGEYFIQRVDLGNKEYTEHFDCPDYWNEEKQQLKYQIGEGCEIDQVLAQWHANLCGIGDIFDKTQLKTALKNMVKNNFKPSMRDYVNAWRVFAMNDEAATIMCDYPEGSERPVIPVPYVDECMTGFEYSFAGLLISEGFVDEGLKIVRAVRDRYDGKKRNPWNEIECGSNYARAMASFALLPIFSGFEFDLPKFHVGFKPITDDDFNCFWCLGTGWGVYEQKEKTAAIVIKDGYVSLTSVSLKNAENIKEVICDGKKLDYTIENGIVKFGKTTVSNELKFIY